MTKNHGSNGDGSILQVLERNLQDSGKRTLRECLRSKSLPCREVKYLMENGISHHQIVEAYQKLCSTGYLENALQSQQQLSSGSLSLCCMTRVATITKFLQLLFEWQKASFSDTPTETTNQLQILQMASTLLKHICGAVLSWMQVWKVNNVDDGATLTDLWETDISDDFHAPMVASFAFGSLVRINSYIKTHPALVSPWLKGLCDIATAIPNLPTNLLGEGVKAVVTYLREGEEQVSALWASILCSHRDTNAPSSGTSAKQQQMLVRILIFLLARATTLVKLALQDDGDKKKIAPDISEMFAIMARLQGLSFQSLLPPTTMNPLLLDAFGPLTAKLKECLCKLMFRKRADQWNTAILQKLALEYFLQGTQEDRADWNDRALFGKVNLILTILQEYAKAPGASFAEADVEGLLAFIRELVFHCLPLFQAHLTPMDPFHPTTHPVMMLVSRSMETISKTLLLCDLRSFCMLTNADRGRGHYHRLLIRWLAPPPGEPCNHHHHPMTREIIVSLLCLHVVGLHRISAVNYSNSPRSVQAVPTPHKLGQGIEDSLVLLLVKLLLDTRTATILRDGIGSVLTRLLLVDNLCEKVANRITEELQRLFAQEKKCGRKRKRGQGGAQRLSVEDVNIIGRLVSKLQLGKLSSSSLIEQESNDFVGELLTMKQSSASQRPRRRNATLTFLLMSLLEAKLSSSNQLDPKRSTVEAHLFQILAICCSSKTWIALGCIRKQLAMATCFVRFVSTVCQACPRNLPPELVACLAEFVANYTNQDDGGQKDKEGDSLAVLLEVVSLLGHLGNVILPTCQARVGEALMAAFRSLQKRGEWPLLVLTMTSLMRFASTIPPAQRDLLPRCTLKENFGYFQSRLQGGVWKLSRSQKHMDASDVMATCAKALQELIAKRLGTIVFPITTSFVVPAGSYFMMVPTREGRKAVAIFPPTDESLEDIDAVLGLDEAKVLKLRRVISLSDGCKFLLQPP